MITSTYLTELDLPITLDKSCRISVWNTFNYQNNCINIILFDWLVTHSYKGAKSEILITSLVCRW